MIHKRDFLLVVVLPCFSLVADCLAIVCGMSVHATDPNWLSKSRRLGVLNRLTPILLNLAIQHGVTTPIIASVFRLNEGSVHNHLSRFGASRLRLREELVLLSLSSAEPTAGGASKYEGVIPLRLLGIRPRLIAEEFGLSESMLRTFFHERGVEEELRVRLVERASQGLVDAVEQGLLPPGLLN